MAGLDLEKLNKALASALSLISLGGEFAVLGLQVYEHIKAQGGMTDEQIRTHRDLTLDANERKLLENLRAAGEDV